MRENSSARVLPSTVRRPIFRSTHPLKPDSLKTTLGHQNPPPPHRNVEDSSEASTARSATAGVYCCTVYPRKQEECLQQSGLEAELLSCRKAPCSNEGKDVGAGVHTKKKAARLASPPTAPLPASASWRRRSNQDADSRLARSGARDEKSRESGAAVGTPKTRRGFTRFGCA